LYIHLLIHAFLLPTPVVKIGGQCRIRTHGALTGSRD
jgi:hypothetical protein